MALIDFTSFVERDGLPAARDRFERLIAQLVRLRHPDAQEVQVKRGDRGLDVIVGPLSGDVRIWQAKFLFPAFTPKEQGAQAQRSLQQAVKFIGETGGRIAEWTLCLPVKMNADGHRWWDHFTTRNAAAADSLSRWTLTDIESMLLEPKGREIRIAYFDVRDAESGYLVPPETGVRDADPEALGIAHAIGFAGEPAYVRRDHDEELEQRVIDGGTVLLVGESAAGKSRTLIEALRRLRGDAQIIAPDPRLSLRALAARVGRLRDIDRSRRAVIWLENLDQFLHPNGLALADVKALAAEPDVLLAATIRRAAYAPILAAGDQRAAILRVGTPALSIDSQASRTERREFARTHPTRALDETGIGAHFVALERLRDRLDVADDDVQALVELAVDWHRVTTNRPLNTRRLRGLVELVHGDARARAFGDALAAGKRRGDDEPPLLLVSANERVTIPDPLVDFAEGLQGGRKRPVRREVRRAMVSVADGEAAAAIARAADAAGDPETELAALRIASSHGGAATRAAAHLRLSELTGDPDAFVDHCSAALDATAPEEAVEAALRLLAHEEESGDELDSEFLSRIEETLRATTVLDERVVDALAKIADRREEPQMLEALLSDLPAHHPGIAVVARRLVRHRINDREAVRGLLQEVVDIGGYGALGEAGVVFADLAIENEDWSAAAEALAAVGAELGADALSAIDRFTRQFAEAGHQDLLKPVHMRLAASRDIRAKSLLQAHKQPADAAATAADAIRRGEAAASAGDVEAAIAAFAHAAAHGNVQGEQRRAELALELEEREARRLEERGDLHEALAAWEELHIAGHPSAVTEALRIEGLIAWDRLTSIEGRGGEAPIDLFAKALEGGVAGARERAVATGREALAEAREAEAAQDHETAFERYERAAAFGEGEARAWLDRRRQEPA